MQFTVVMFLSLTLLAVAISHEAADRQAAQNLEISKHNREVAAAHHELAHVHQDVQSERHNLSSGWNDLESERRQIAHDRRTQSLLAALVPMVGTIAVVVAALYFLLCRAIGPGSPLV
ncbi:MAG: hypothetical protein WD851_12165 [Pirellulales bacterium]